MSITTCCFWKAATFKPRKEPKFCTVTGKRAKHAFCRCCPVELGRLCDLHRGRGWRSGAPSDEDIQKLVVTIAKRVIRFFQKKGYFQDEIDTAVPEKDLAQETLLPENQAASIQSRIALGERKGGWVRRLGNIDCLKVERTGRLCAQAAGFSLHAAVYCKPWERGMLEMICRYITRPAVAEERLELQASGNVVLRLKTPYAGGRVIFCFRVWNLSRSWRR